MSKHKVGDKFIVEIDNIMSSRKGEAYGVKGLKTLVFDDCGLGKLERYNDAVHTRTYEDGLADAWEAARKITCNKDDGGLCAEELCEIFGTVRPSNAMVDNTPQEAIAKIKEWEDSKEIKRGDEMVHVMDVNEKMIVTYIAVDNDFIHGINRTGDLYSCADPANWRKTGRNFADKLDALLGEIGGDTNGQD